LGSHMVHLTTKTQVAGISKEQGGGERHALGLLSVFDSLIW